MKSDDPEVTLLAELRAVCAKLPGAEEYVMVHHPAFRIGKKPFAIVGIGRDTKQPRFSINLGPEAQLDLLDDPRFIKTPYLGRHGWVSVARADVKLAELSGLVIDSWRRVATSKQRAAYTGATAAAPAKRKR